MGEGERSVARLPTPVRPRPARTTPDTRRPTPDTRKNDARHPTPVTRHPTPARATPIARHPSPDTREESHPTPGRGLPLPRRDGARHPTPVRGALPALLPSHSDGLTAFPGSLPSPLSGFAAARLPHRNGGGERGLAPLPFRWEGLGEGNDPGYPMGGVGGGQQPWATPERTRTPKEPAGCRVGVTRSRRRPRSGRSGRPIRQTAAR